MREIKFRTWNKIKQKMDYNPLAYWNDGCINTAFEISENSEKEDLILMQYTGLKDKNGKDIYEGDIVKSSREKNVGKVIFEEERGQFGFEVIKGDGLPGIHISFAYANTMKKCEIIGNIYENKEIIN